MLYMKIKPCPKVTFNKKAKKPDIYNIRYRVLFKDKRG